MKRRVICTLLAALILISLMPALGFGASAASNLKTSEEAIELLKEMEGFVEKPIWDNSQYSVGYGSSCGKDDYPDGITVEEADLLLREKLEIMEAAVNNFDNKYSLNLKQNQFDALMLFTYNCGTGWTKTDSDFRQAIIDGLTGNDFLYYITRWCTASKEIKTHLIKRRLIEADMYLYGTYENRAPSSYTYVLFDLNGGSAVESKIQGYDASNPTAIKPVPEFRTGYRFLGWYTAASGGKWVDVLDANTTGKTLYAHWQKEEGDVSEDGEILGAAASYTRYVAGSALPVYDAPAAAGAVVKTLEVGAEVKITADYVDSDGKKWGKLSDGGWVNLAGTEAKTTAADAPVRNIPSTVTIGVNVTVTGSNVNIRNGAGTGYTSLGYAQKGDKMIITQTVQDGDLKWGKFNGGWICLLYTDYDVIMEQNSSNTDTVTATGVIINCDKLRVRAGAGTNFDCVGTLPVGTKVEITQQKVVGDYTWGRISSGWIRLDYVKLTPVAEKPEEVPEETEPTAPETEPEEETKEESKEETEEETKTESITGTVTADALNIRSGAGTSYSVQGRLKQGAVVTILEQKTVGSMNWGRIDKGWICLNYVKLSVSSGSNNNNSSSGTGETTTVTGTVKVSGYLNVRSGAGTGNKAVGKLTNGTKVEILSTTTVNGVTWGKISSGWISMQYVVLDSTSSGGNTSTQTTTGTVTADALRIRSGAGTNQKVVGVYYQGQKVTILEKTTVDGVAWGRTNKGWICLDYVK